MATPIARNPEQAAGAGVAAAVYPALYEESARLRGLYLTVGAEFTFSTVKEPLRLRFRDGGLWCGLLSAGGYRIG